jgi:hypothetical protein
MLELFIKLILVSFYAIMTGCSPNGHLTENLEPQGKAMFDPENRTMLGYKLYDNMDNISKDPHYTFLRKEDDVTYYTVKNKNNDPRQISIVVSVRNDKIYSVESRYQYPHFRSCNAAAEQIYNETKNFFPLEKRPDVNDKGYHFDGVLKNYIFITACTDLLDTDKIIHSTTYMR